MNRTPSILLAAILVVLLGGWLSAEGPSPQAVGEEELFELPSLAAGSLVGTADCRAWFYRAEESHALRYRLDLTAAVPDDLSPTIVRTLTLAAPHFNHCDAQALHPRGSERTVTGAIDLRRALGDRYRAFAEANGSVLLTFTLTTSGDGEVFGDDVRVLAAFAMPVASYGRWVAGQWEADELPQ